MTFIIKIETSNDPDREVMCDYDADPDAVMDELERALIRLEAGRALTVTCVQCDDGPECPEGSA